jgi:hypothetical protein
MTLILSYASRNILIQVSDRLVSRGSAPYDTLANKCVIYSAADGIVALAYTGLAYIRQQPTDDWIAKFLEQQVPGRIKLGRSLLLLKDALEHAANNASPEWKRQWRASWFETSILGWQWDARGRSRPLVLWMSKAPDGEALELGYFPRWWFLDGTYRVIACPGPHYPLERLRPLTDKLRVQSVDEAEAIIVDAIKEVSTRIPQVGPNCMTIAIHPPKTGLVRVRYIPTSQALADVSFASGVQRVAVAFSPWILMPGLTLPPSVISGSGWEAHPAGPYAVALHAPDDPRLAGLLHAQPRHPSP